MPRLVKAAEYNSYWQDWQARGLYVFCLPPHSLQMNPIEDERLHLKSERLAAQVFEDESELALALIAAIEARGL